MSEEKLEALDALVEKTGVGTRTELINNALTLLNWAVKEIEAGRMIASVNGGEVIKEVELPALSFENQTEYSHKALMEIMNGVDLFIKRTGIPPDELANALEEAKEKVIQTYGVAKQGGARVYESGTSVIPGKHPPKHGE